MSGFKYTILVSAQTEQAQKALHNLSTTFGNMGAGFAGQMYNMFKYLDGTRDKVSGLAQRFGANILQGAAIGGAAAAAIVGYDMLKAGSAAVAELGSSLMDVGVVGLKTIGAGLWEVANTAGEVESTVMRMKMLGGYTDQAAWNAVKSVQKIVEFTPYLQRDVMKVAELLATAGHSLDPLTDKYGKVLTLSSAASQGMTRVSKDTLEMAGNMEITSQSMILDLAAVSGQVGPKFTNMVQSLKTAFMSGQIRNLRENLSGDYYKILGDAINDAKKKGLDTAGRTGLMMEAVYKELVRKGQLGFSAEASASWEGIISNFVEIPDILKRAIGNAEDPKGPYGAMKRAMLGLYKSIKPAVTDEKFLTGLRDSIVPIVDALGWMAQKLGESVTWVTKFLGANPYVMKMVVYFTTLGSVLTLVSGVLLLIGGTLAGLLLTGLATLLVTLVALGIAAAAFMQLIVPALVAVGALLLGAAVGTGVIASWEKFTALVEDIGWLFTGVSEAIRFWGKSTTSVTDETKAKLEKAGLWETFLRVVDIMTWAHEAWKGFMDRLSSGSTTIMPKLISGWDSFSSAMSKVWTATRILLEAIGVIGPATGTNVAGARGSFIWLADSILVLAEIAAWTFDTIGTVIDWCIAPAQSLAHAFMWIVGVTHLMGNAATIAAGTMFMALTPVMSVLTDIVSMVMTLASVFEDLSNGGMDVVVGKLFGGKYAKEHAQRSSKFMGKWITTAQNDIATDFGDIGDAGFLTTRSTDDLRRKKGGSAGWYWDAVKATEGLGQQHMWQQGADGRLRPDAPYNGTGSSGIFDNLAALADKVGVAAGARSEADSFTTPMAGMTSATPPANISMNHTFNVSIGDETIETKVVQANQSFFERNGVVLPMSTR